MRTNYVRISNFVASLAIGLVLSFAVNAQEPGEIVVKEVDGVNAVILKATVPTQQIGEKMPEMFGKLYGYLGGENIQPVGAAFTVYLSYDPEGDTEFAVGAPVASKVEVDGDFKYKEFPKSKAVTTLYKGPYEEMGPVYENLMAYLDENELTPTGQAWEVYLTNPQEVADPKDNETLIYFTIEE